MINEEKLYKNEIFSMLSKQKNVLETVRGGDLSAVCWRAETSGSNGTQDTNQTARLKLLYYMLFARDHDEQTVSQLFEEEIKSRETDSFQGIGAALEVLTSLLQKYNNNGQYEPLFERAKNANFDCFCGYNQDHCLEENLENWPLEDCIGLAVNTQYYDTARNLIRLWESSVENWDVDACRMLVHFNQRSGQPEANERPYQALLALARQKGDMFSLASTYRDLFHLYIQCGRGSEALKTFRELQKEVDFWAISRCNLLQYLLEDCMDFICAFPQRARPVWRWARGYLDGTTPLHSEPYGNLYKKSIAAAQVFHDRLADKLEADYAAWRSKYGI